MKQVRPPKIIIWLIWLLTRPGNRATLLGDIEEEYRIIVSESGQFRAKLWSLRQVIYPFVYYIRSFNLWSTMMLKNYIKIGVRNILRHKGYSFINIFGLAAGMACCILILLWVQDELSFDRFHKNRDNIYRVLTEIHTNQEFTIYYTPPSLANSLKEDFPEVMEAFRLGRTGWAFKYGDSDKNIFQDQGLLADPAILSAFSFPLIMGDPETALSDPLSVVISEKMAKICFGDQNPIGKTLLFDTEYILTVTGVHKDVPDNSHLQFEYLVPFEFLQHRGRNIDTWDSNRWITYVLLNEGNRPDELNAKIAGLVKAHVPESTAVLKLQPLREIHLYSLTGTGMIVYVYIFSAIALLVLLIACINFMNLTTARSDNRLKEVGLRKVVGAYRSDIIRQFYGESILQSLFALLLAAGIVILLLPAFNELTGKQLSLAIAGNLYLIPGLMIIAVLTGIIAGSYPSLYFSSFRPVNAIRGSGGTAVGRGAKFRKALVILQFSLSIIFITGTLVVSKQLSYIREKNLGFEKENLLVMRTGNVSDSELETLRNELKQNSSIENITFTNSRLLYLGIETSKVSWEGKSDDQKISIQIRSVDYDYLETFRMEMAEGRFFSREYPSDTANCYIINEAAVKTMGLESPIGKNLTLGDETGRIIGVVKDFHHHSLRTEIEPLCFIFNPSWNTFMFVRTAPGRSAETLGLLEKNWDRIDPGYTFTVFYLADRIDRLYRSEQRVGKLSGYFSAVAIIIACLGLFGLASYMAEKRTKEIGIRKVLGASVSGIIFLLSKEFFIWIAAANIISWPIAWYFLDNWLQGFAYKSPLGIGIFAAAGILSLIIALITVSFQAIKVARANPVNSLKYE